MNEFELAEIALLEKSYALELELVTQGYISTLQTEASILLSMIFGYLLVAHFIGESLSRTQVMIFNSLYLFTVSSSLFVYNGHYQSIIFGVHRLIALRARDAEDIPLAGTPDGAQIVIIAYTAMIIASLYFMWTVRHPKERGIDKLKNPFEGVLDRRN